MSDDYQPPAIWEFEEQEGNMGKINRPTSGAQFERELPRGDHALQLYSLGTPNGVKVTTLLEALNLEYGIEYDAWKINILDGDQFGSGFVSVNPNSKIPALLHYDKKGEEPVRVFESAAIMLYLCEKFDKDSKFIPPIGDPLRAECLSWLFWVQGSAPYLGGGFGHFYHYAPLKIKYAIDRFTMEAKRQWDVLDKHLGGADGKGPRNFLCGDKVTIADFCCWPWHAVAVKYYDAIEFVQFNGYKNIAAWSSKMKSIKAVQRGQRIHAFDVSIEGGIVNERHSAADLD